MTIEKRTEPATVTMNYYICDICGLETKSILKACSICGKHLCANCYSKERCTILTYLSCCRSCYNIKDKYETKIKQSEHDCENFIEKCHDHIQKQEQLTFETINKLKEQWKNESLM
jgi:hypothetical protein